MHLSAFEHDARSEHGALFLAVREYIRICIGNGVKEKRHKKSTAFSAREGGFCSITVNEDGVVVRWFRGCTIDDPFGLLHGSGKRLRLQKVAKLDAAVRRTIRHYVEESRIGLIEQQAMRQLKGAFKSGLDGWT